MLNQEAIPPEWEVPVHNLPPIGSSPDGLVYHPALPQPPPAADAATHLSTAPPGASTATSCPSPQAEVSAIARAAERRQRAAMAGGRRWTPEVYEAIALPGLWEVVEVKNHCPFQVRPSGRLPPLLRPSPATPGSTHTPSLAHHRSWQTHPQRLPAVRMLSV